MKKSKLSKPIKILKPKLRLLYKKYEREYLYASIKMELKGVNMWSKQLTLGEFERQYKNYKIDPTRKGSIIKTIVKHQKYQLSQKQAKAIKEYIKQSEGIEAANKLKLREIRVNSAADYIDIRGINERRKELNKQGYDKKEIAKMIGEEFFGS